jgi:hypothetical protein
MTRKTTDVSFKNWLMVRKLLTKKASGDVVSRLKRCIKIQPLEGYDDPIEYFNAILQNPAVENIPVSSRNSMSRASRLYFEFANHNSQ